MRARFRGPSRKRIIGCSARTLGEVAQGVRKCASEHVYGWGTRCGRGGPWAVQKGLRTTSAERLGAMRGIFSPALDVRNDEIARAMHALSPLHGMSLVSDCGGSAGDWSAKRDWPRESSRMRQG